MNTITNQDLNRKKKLTILNIDKAIQIKNDKLEVINVIRGVKEYRLELKQNPELNLPTNATCVISRYQKHEQWSVDVSGIGIFLLKQPHVTLPTLKHLEGILSSLINKR